SAKPASNFVQVEPMQGQPATQETEIRVLYNKQFLYFGVFSKDSLGKQALRAVDFKRDFDFRQHDLVSLCFDGFKDERNAMVFATNPYGVQRDLLSFDDTFYDVDWDGLWRVRTSRTDSGWVAEIAIPWQTLRYPKSADSLQTWGFNLYRNRRSTNEATTFSPYPRAYAATRMAYAGLLTNLQPPPPKPNIRLQPYALVSYDRLPANDLGKTSKEWNFKPGGDVKWAINTNTVLDLTANTDFAQADVDRQVNNVTRFSVFFPERRQFFLENASLFGFNAQRASDGSGGGMAIQPFFSRTIGLDDAGRPIPIEAGGRFVYRSTEQNFGAIAMRQREKGDSPATNFFVGRYSKNFGNQNRIGGLMTIKNRPDGSNVVSTVDGFFRLSDEQSINAFVMHSAGGQSEQQGFAGIAQYFNSTNNYKIWWTQSIVTKDFNPEMGFVSRKDVIGTTPGMNWYYRGDLLPFRKLIRAFEPGFLPELYWQASTGKLIERQMWLFPLWLNFQKGGYLGYSLNPVYQNLTEAFEPLGITIAEGQYNYFQQSVWFSSDPSKIVYLWGQVDWGGFFDGRLNSADVNLQFAPSPHFSLAGRINRNKFKDIGIMDSDKTIDLYSIEGRFALNPRLQLIAFYQQNSENETKNYNIRLAWEYRPLSFLYIVLNKNGFKNYDLNIRQSEDHAIVKLSYLRQL
ncbi:MAG: carbohydrate binding family 9 domain-containing protein, partial [Saprospiraceae bacterium]|nr:carbohydrate binding family 9 domain-containing protein [Saprospiraceae bacterium]